VALYERALSHRSISEDVAENNERLEYLGDAVLGTIVADYLFKKYPYKDEGFLTEMRSKMVNRHQLNDIAIKMGLKNLTRFNTADNALRNSQIFGNTLEALVGAIYLDKGYEKTRQWIMTQILTPYLSVDELEQVEINLKNKLIGWAGRNNKDIQFETVGESAEAKEGFLQWPFCWMEKKSQKAGVLIKKMPDKRPYWKPLKPSHYNQY